MRIINADCLQWMNETDERFDCIFADPPDNIGLGYDTYEDEKKDDDYLEWLGDVLLACMGRAPTVWWSFNSKWTVSMGQIVDSILRFAGGENWECKCCVQVFTFGQHNNNDFGNNHRPLWRIKHKKAPIYPEQIRVPSWRQRNGDKRASPKGRVPGDVFDMQYELPMKKAAALGLSEVDIEVFPGSVFDFPRVTGNSAQRCDWHPTQLHEDLVERCIKSSTLEGQRVLDPFGGTGTTGRVCDRINRAATLVDIDSTYCSKMAAKPEYPTK